MKGLLYDIFLFPFLTKLRYEILSEILAIRPGGVLDICCGTGDQVKIISKKGGLFAAGIDIDKEMIFRRGKRFPLSVQDATNQGIRSSSFDMTMITLALHDKNTATGIKILNESFRVLKPGGVMLICDFDLDEKTSLFSRILITLIEFIAGGEHFRNFRVFTTDRTLDYMISNSGFEVFRRRKVYMESFTITLLKKN